MIKLRGEHKFYSTRNLESDRMKDTFESIQSYENKGCSSPVVTRQMTKEERIKYGLETN